MENTNLLKPKKDSRITLIQYACSILIIYIHAVNYTAWNLSGKAYGGVIFFEKAAYHFTSIAVPIFFFFSGYLMFSHFEYKKYTAAMKKRLYSLVVPYVFWNTIFYLLYAAMTHIQKIAEHMNMEPYPLNIKFFLQGLYMSKFTPLWYIRVLFVYSIFSIIIYPILKNKYTGFTFIVLTILNMVFKVVDHEYLYWIIFVVIGGYVSLQFKDFKFSEKNRPLKIALSAAVVAALFVISFDTVGTAFYFYRIAACILVPFIAGSLIKRDLKVHWVFTISLFTYCIHYAILQIVMKLFLVVLGSSPLSAVLCYIFAPVITIMIITLAAFVLRKYFNRLWVFVNGGRKV